jgi:hypothetical protein
MFLPFVLVVGLVFGFLAITEYASGPDTQVQAPINIAVLPRTSAAACGSVR